MIRYASKRTAQNDFNLRPPSSVHLSSRGQTTQNFTLRACDHTEGDRTAIKAGERRSDGCGRRERQGKKGEGISLVVAILASLQDLTGPTFKKVSLSKSGLIFLCSWRPEPSLIVWSKSGQKTALDQMIGLRRAYHGRGRNYFENDLTSEVATLSSRFYDA
ncbi:hypothetical protein SUGI_1164490 [Cryptomeria japonica]|nr:hypothetical protein SUGI_1164490 [Cryptomeria japonica]